MTRSASRTHANLPERSTAHDGTASESTTRTASTTQPSRKRLIILALLFVTVVINYRDRSNLSIAAPALFKELNIDRYARASYSRHSAGPMR